MGDFSLDTPRGELMMALPASMPLYAAGDGEALAREDEPARDEYVSGESHSFGTGTAVAIGVAVLITTAAGWFMRMKIRRTSVQAARGDVLSGIMRLVMNSPETYAVLQKIAGLKAGAAKAMGSELSELYEHGAILLDHDLKAEGELGRIGLGVTLMEYWKRKGHWLMREAMERAVTLTYYPAKGSLAKAARMHSFVAKGLESARDAKRWDDIFAKALHEIASGQLMYRHALSSARPAEQIDVLKRAYEMLRHGLITLSELKSGWAREQGDAVAEEIEATTPSREEDVTQDVDPEELASRESLTDKAQAQYRNALDRLSLIRKPAETLERDIYAKIRKLSDFDRGPNGSDGSGSVSFMDRTPPRRPKGGPRDPNSAAFVARPRLANLRPCPVLSGMSIFMRPATFLR